MLTVGPNLFGGEELKMKIYLDKLLKTSGREKLFL
jgi:hypothetical protein